MTSRCFESGWVLVGVILMLGPVASLRAAEPQVGFIVKNGDLEFAVRQDGKPIVATISVQNEDLKQIAEGETGDDGRGRFPLPREESFTFIVTVAGRTADPIELHRTDTGVEPGKVLLSFGLRPCCRIPSRGGISPSDTAETISVAPWLKALGAGVCLVAGGALIFLAWRPTPNRGTQTP